MPKLHDACQILSEDLLSRLGRFAPSEAAYALALACHAVEVNLTERQHPQSEEISRHLWMVLDETLARLRPDLASPAGPVPVYGEEAPLREDDIRLAYYCAAAVDEARRLFPTRTYRI